MIIVLVPINVLHVSHIMCVTLFLECLFVSNIYPVYVILAVLTLPVRHCAHLNCESFMHVNIVSL